MEENKVRVCVCVCVCVWKRVWRVLMEESEGRNC